ncbi:MAG: hypothetical protein J0L62_16120 [Bacteroidetes bacterium]|nr:hypothetical protein [Bacteroidota bacterium]
MKVLILIFLFIFSWDLSTAQNSSVYRFPAARLSADRPDIDTLSNLNSKPVLFDADTVYVINQTGINHYLYAVNQVNKIRSLLVPISGLENNLTGIRLGLNRLDSSNTDFSEFLVAYQEKNRIQFLQLSRENSNLTNQLKTLDENLEKTNGILKNEKSGRMKSNLLWGGGGLVFGGILVLILK